MNADDFNLAMAQFSLKYSKLSRHRFYRKLQGLLEMNEPLPRCLERLWLNTSDHGRKPTRTMPVLLKHWLKRLRMGETFSVSLEGSLPQSDVTLIRAGEESGMLSTSLTSIMLIDESTSQMKAAIKKAIVYPIFMSGILLGVLYMFGTSLIAPMRASAPPKVMESIAGLAAVTGFVTNYALIVVGILFAIGVALTLSMPVVVGRFRVKLDKFPPWSWFRISQGSSFLLGMGALLQAQVSMRRALEILNETGGPWWHERLEACLTEVMRGRNIGEALRITEFGFPDTEIAMDLELLAERSDVSAVLDIIVREWMSEQIRKLDTQANVIRSIGTGVIGAVIAWAMLSIVGLSTTMANGGMK